MRYIAIILFALMTISCAVNGQTQDSTAVKLTKLQSNLNKYYNQTRTGSVIFAFGTILGTSTIFCVSHLQKDRDMRNALLGVSAGSMVLGLLINMEAIKFIGNESEITLSPTSISIKF